ncbi:MAG: hypothetical protein ACLQIB_04405 [Isosphaeraceae bacterium]
MPTLDGNPVFGYASHVRHNPHPSAQQFNAFFGINGQQTLHGGSRGRTFLISGVFAGSSFYDITNAEAALLTYADGQPHTLVDNLGRTWANVIFRGDYEPFAEGPRPLAGGGWCLPFKCVMEALT